MTELEFTDGNSIYTFQIYPENSDDFHVYSYVTIHYRQKSDKYPASDYCSGQRIIEGGKVNWAREDWIADSAQDFLNRVLQLSAFL